MLELQFFFDYACPWSYMAFGRAREAAMRTGATIAWRPLSVQRVFAAVNPERAASWLDPNPRKSGYQVKDLKDWANFCSVPFEMPDNWPVDSRLVLCGAVAANEQQLMVAFSQQVFMAYFAEGRDIGNDDVVAELARAAGLDMTAYAARMSDSSTLTAIHDNADELVRRGGFGTPTLFVGDDMYFGNDRMPLIELALGQASDQTFVMPGQHSSSA